MSELKQSDQWQTPARLFSILDQEFHFDHDLCASKYNFLCSSWSSDIELFLANYDNEPFHSYWMNPPYSRGNIEKCMEAAVKIFMKPATQYLVTLTRFDPSTRWYQQWVDGVATEVRMLSSRVKFVGASSAYNFPCCVAVYDKDYGPHVNPLGIFTEYLIWGDDYV